MGDFNARTGTLPDFFTPDVFLSQVDMCETFSHNEIRIRSAVFKKRSSPLQRVEQDVTVNNFGYKLRFL